jgi:O-methyltransferase
MKFVTFGRLLYQKYFDKQNGDRASFVLAERFASFWYPRMSLSGFGATWLDDTDFFDFHHRFVPHTRHTADRKFFLRSLLLLVEDLPGDTAECGAWEGASSWLICDKFRNSDKAHFIFDSCDGLSQPGPGDGDHWTKGDLYVTEETLRLNLAEFPRAKICPGWIPERFREVAHRRFCFVHIDVDLYQPTLDSLSFFYPLMVPGGVILFDDYGCRDCPGATLAIDELMADKPEKIIHVPTAQAFIMKR